MEPKFLIHHLEDLMLLPLRNCHQTLMWKCGLEEVDAEDFLEIPVLMPVPEQNAQVCRHVKTGIMEDI